MKVGDGEMTKTVCTTRDQNMDFQHCKLEQLEIFYRKFYILS